MYRYVTETPEQRSARCRRNASQPKKPFSEWDTKLTHEQRSAISKRAGAASKGVRKNVGNRNASGERSVAFRKACQQRALCNPDRINRYCTNGRFYGTKTPPEGVWYDSKYEKRFLEACECDQDVTAVDRAGVRIPYDDEGFTRIYLPDFLVDKSGSKVLVEVKPVKFLNRTKNLKKFEAGRKFAAERGWVYKIVTEQEIERMLISSQADRMGQEVGRKVQRLPVADSHPIRQARVPRSVVAGIVLILVAGYEIVRHPGEIQGAGINNPAITVDNMEANANIPEIDLQLTSSPVVARKNALRARWSIEAQQDLQAYHGVKAETELIAFMTNEIMKEINYKIIRHIYAIASAGAVAWNRTPAANVPWIWHKESLYDALIQGANLVFQRTQRVTPNWIVAGVGVCNVLETLSKFKATGAATGITGIRKIGTIGPFQVYKDPSFGNDGGTTTDDDFLMGYKGASFLETGYIWAPYLPLYMTGTVVLDDMMARKALAQRSGLKVVNSGMYATGRITQSGGAFTP